MGHRGVVLLDRDGVLNCLVPHPPDGHGESPLEPGQVRLCPGVGACLRKLRGEGYLLACVTNQPSAAKGTLSLEEVHAVHATVVRLLHDDGIDLDASRMCLHHPDGVVPELRVRCDCRKPEPGMLLDVLSDLAADASRSWMIGDTDADVLAGQAAGVRTVMVESDAGAHKRSRRVAPDARVQTLAEAVGIIVGR